MRVKVLYQPPGNGECIGSIFVVIAKADYLEVKEQVDHIINTVGKRPEYDLTLPSDEEMKAMRKEAYRKFYQAIKKENEERGVV